MDDTEHLRHYANTGSDDAFAAVVHRFLPLVYAAALRRVGGDTHRAQDVTQLVFTALARNASALAKHPDLTGWLFTSTRFLAAKAIRGERRRQLREHEASLVGDIMNDDSSRETPASLHAMLDEVTMELRQLDRQMILLRFHRGLRLAEIGAQLGVTENAVQKRIDRALDQLKEKLARRGVTSTAAALALAIEQQSAVAVPAGLAASATTAGIACGSGAGSLLVISSLMTISKLQLGLAAAVVAATSAGLVWEVRENAALRAEAANAAATRVTMSTLTEKLASLTQRADAAEADAIEQAEAAMDRAAKLAEQGKLQEALDEYLKCYRDLTAKGSVEQQRVMQGIASLGAKYPPAIAAVRELRDTAMRKLAANLGTQELVNEIGLLNERLGEGRASIALYDTLPPGDPGRQSLALMAHGSFVEARRYNDALVGKPFGGMLNELELLAGISARAPGPSVKFHRTDAINYTLTNIEALTGAGRLDDARLLTEKLLAFDGSDATRAAIKQHVERATAPHTSP